MQGQSLLRLLRARGGGGSELAPGKSAYAAARPILPSGQRPRASPGSSAAHLNLPKWAAAPQKGGTELQRETERFGRTNDTQSWPPSVLEGAQARGPERR